SRMPHPLRRRPRSRRAPTRCLPRTPAKLAPKLPKAATRPNQLRHPPTSRRHPRLALTRKPTAVAITGGIGAGKTETLRAFERHRAATASSDAIVHRLLRDDGEVHAALREHWGDRIVGANGADRGAIADIVFSNPTELAWLESLLHPRV